MNATWSWSMKAFRRHMHPRLGNGLGVCTAMTHANIYALKRNVPLPGAMPRSCLGPESEPRLMTKRGASRLAAFQPSSAFYERCTLVRQACTRHCTPPRQVVKPSAVSRKHWSMRTTVTHASQRLLELTRGASSGEHRRHRLTRLFPSISCQPPTSGHQSSLA